MAEQLCFPPRRGHAVTTETGVAAPTKAAATTEGSV
jgi:hypothetical protein